MAKDVNDKQTIEGIATLWIAGYTTFGADHKLRTGRIVVEATTPIEAKQKMLATLAESKVPNPRIGNIKPY